jgi:hypothetical protein
VRFGHVGTKPVFWEYAGGKPPRSTLRYGAGQGRYYYQKGDLLDEGEYELRELKERFPDAGIEGKGPSFWDVVSSLAGMHETEKLRLVRHLDRINPDPGDPWRGTAETSFYLIIDNRAVPLTGRNSHEAMRATEGNGSLNDYVGLAPAAKSMLELAEVVQAEIEIVGELAKDASLSAVGKGLKAMKIVQELAESKWVLRIEKALKYIDANRLTSATKAFVEAFWKEFKHYLGQYTLKQLAGGDAMVKVDPKTEGTAFTFDTAVVTATSTVGAGNAYVSVGKAPELDFTKALAEGSLAFVRTLFLDHGLAAAISKVVSKKFKNKEMEEAAAKYVQKVLTGLGKKYWSDATAAAAQRAIKDNNGGKNYERYLKEELTNRLGARLTKDFLAGVLKAAAEGFE